MTLGENIKQLRKDKNLTQEDLADKLDVSFQAISSWERDMYKPEVEKLMKLAEVLDVSVSRLLEEKQQVFKTKQAIFDWQHMKTFVKTYARAHHFKNTLVAVD
ncbi:MAG: helix-turn-helix transcriptional regulator, partial [Solobacterium sp.]|nr:helix-turn-helix transcriptional regulator [Solobacterium sp.]